MTSGGAPRQVEPTALMGWEGEPSDVWARSWDVPVVEIYDVVSSTNDRARELARTGAPPFSVVLAERQTAGRGRSGGTWESGAGMSVLATILLPPSGGARAIVPLLVGLAVCRAIEECAPTLVARLKWPNDVLIGERKVCGILCEGGGAGDPVVAGIGINVRQKEADFYKGIRRRSTSLEDASGRPVSRSVLLGTVIREMKRLLTEPHPSLIDAESREITARDALVGREIQVVPGPMGVARGIDSRGRLRVETPTGETRLVVAGAVRVEGWGSTE